MISLSNPSFHTHSSFPLTHTQAKNAKRVFQPFPPAGRIPLLQKLYANPRLFSGLGKYNPAKSVKAI